MYEIQMLLMGRLAFERIYFHLLAGQLAAFNELGTHLSNLLDGKYLQYQSSTLN